VKLKLYFALTGIYKWINKFCSLLYVPLMQEQGANRYGFSPVWVFTWLSKFGRVVKTFPHTQHMCAYPLYNLVCWYKSKLHLNILPNQTQSYGCLTVCKVLCFPKLPFSINCWPQRKQCYGFSPVCIFRCKFIFYTAIPHTAHWFSLIFLSLRSDTQNVPSHWLKNIPHYSATNK
jgi:hypothetical protein